MLIGVVFHLFFYVSNKIPVRNLANFTDLTLVEEVKSKGHQLTRKTLDPGPLNLSEHFIIIQFFFPSD